MRVGSRCSYLDNELNEPLPSFLQPYEQNTSVLTDEYLGEIDRCYKEEYLPKTRDKTEVVCYDWSTFANVEDVVEDIERLPLEEYMNDHRSRKFMDWKGNNARWWDYHRML